jgi:hypothetical protein
MPPAASPPPSAASLLHVASAGRKPLLAKFPCAGPDRCIIAAGRILAPAGPRPTSLSHDSHPPASSSLPACVDGECPATGTPKKARLPPSCAPSPLPLPATAHTTSEPTRRAADITYITARWPKPRNGRLARPPFFDGTSRAATFGRQTASCAAPSFALNATGLAARWSYPASRSLGAFQSQTRLLLKLLPVIGFCSRLQTKSQTPAISPASPPQQWLPP